MKDNLVDRILFDTTEELGISEPEGINGKCYKVFVWNLNNLLYTFSIERSFQH